MKFEIRYYRSCHMSVAAENPYVVPRPGLGPGESHSDVRMPELAGIENGNENLR
jgi:hypothetical protein